MRQNPVLTIGMIFKNDIRSIEQCLRALFPLRRALPCELIMADTGSTDGSREAAAAYADLLFDFPWVNDFSAARNAVMDRASGDWFFTVDSDEYLDGDITELVGFLTSRLSKTAAVAEVVQRNYGTYEMDGAYSDFLAMRLLRMSTGMRYTGEIHESWKPVKGSFGRELPVEYLTKTILHHDGYVGLDDERGKAKRNRNVQLLRQVLERDPDDLLRLLQYVESGGTEADVMERIRHAAALVEAKAPRWQTCGPSLFRQAVFISRERNLPELQDWIHRAESLFPNSFCTRIDVSQSAFGDSWDRQDYADCIRRGETSLAAYAESRSDPAARKEFCMSALLYGSPSHERNLRLFTAFACQKQGETTQALEHLEKLDFQELNERQAGVLAQILPALYAENGVDAVPLVQSAWEGITAPVPSQARANERRTLFLEIGAQSFSAAEGTARPAWGVFLPLAGRCPLGDAAQVMAEEDPDLLEAALASVENWDEFPIAALAHVLMRGTQFPAPGRSLSLEEMDRLATRLSGMPEALFPLALKAKMDMPQQICWTRALIFAAVQIFDWTAGEAFGEGGLTLIRRFAEVEDAFLPLCYAPSALTEENLFLLPPLHRFGWYCARAFAALDGGDPAAYVRELRAGLETAPDMKPMVEFLTKHTPALQPPPPSPELLALAEQVRTLLAAYDPNDPAVAALKASPAYQKVAYLLEDGL